MESEFQNLQIVQFREHPIIDFSQAEPNPYEITSSGLNFPSSFVSKGHFIMDAYCQALIHKIKNLPKINLADFIDFQCSLMSNPIQWLDQLETLLEINDDLIVNICSRPCINKLSFIIQLQRQELKPRRRPLKDQLVNWNEMPLNINDSDKFDFNQVKLDLEKLNSYEDKKAYLIELKADFLQSNFCFTPYSLKPFDTLIDIEFEKLEKLENIKPLSGDNGHSKKTSTNKYPINGNLNYFVDIFYQLIHEVKVEGNNPFLGCTATQITELIVDHFTDKEGHEISASTVKTILTPGKSDKRPSSDKRFNIKNLLVFLFTTSCLGYIFDIQDIAISLFA